MDTDLDSRIQGSVHCINYPGLDPALIFSGVQDANKKLFFSLVFFCLLLTVGVFTSVFKEDNSLRSQQNNTVKRFFIIFLQMVMDPDLDL